MTDTFQGWACHGKGKPLELTELPLKPWEEDDVEIKITDCGMCGSDIHTIDSDWAPANYPVVTGHEMTGIVTRVGKNVTKVKVGDSAGVGPLCYACGDCSSCTLKAPNACKAGYYGTYDSHYPNGQKTFGGYADKWRGNKYCVVKIPQGLSNENACSMMCAGSSTYAPLKRWNVNANSTIGILGLGGLGHFGVLLSKAMGARVVVLSRSESKRKDALELGADDFVNTSDPSQMAKLDSSLTHIMCTGIGKDFTWEAYLPLLVVNGVFINLAIPPFNLPSIPPFLFEKSQVAIVSSIVASPEDTEEMLQLAARKNIKTWYKAYPMQEVNHAIQDFRDGKARFRIVLTNEGFKSQM